MSRLLRVLICAALIALGALSPTYAADSIGNVGKWSVFEERSGTMKTCWTATANDRRILLNGSLLYVAVTKHSGRQPELSVYADRRLPRSGGLTIAIGQSTFRLRSTGQYAWLDQRTDKLAINALKQVEAAGGNANFTVSIPNVGVFDFSAKGFAAALDMTLKRCR